MRDFLNVRSPWFRPVARRVIVTAVCLAWAIVEFATASPFWGVLFGAAGLYLGYIFFFDWRDPDDTEGT